MKIFGEKNQKVNFSTLRLTPFLFPARASDLYWISDNALIPSNAFSEYSEAGVSRTATLDFQQADIGIL